MQVGTYVPPSREKDTRLVRDDEDIAEGFEQFTEDSGRVTLSGKGKREQARKERETMRELIEASETESDSDAERNHAYESAQTHHGMDGLSAHDEQKRAARRPRQPRDVTQIPKLAAGLTRLREMVQRAEFEKARVEKRKADIVRERAEIKASQEHIQRSLEEQGKELERLRLDSNSNSVAPDGKPHGQNGQKEGSSERKSESL